MDDLISTSPHDLILTNTSLASSLLAAFTATDQSSKHPSIVQFDSSDFYGSSEGSTLSLLQFTRQFAQRSTFIDEISYEDQVKILIDLNPIIMYARGPLSEQVINLGLTDYLDFVSISKVFLIKSPSLVVPIPVSKEQVMLESRFNLVEKRKVAKLIVNFNEINSEISLHHWLTNSNGLSSGSLLYDLIAYGVCRCPDMESVSRLPSSQFKECMEAFKESISITGKESPFVYPQYGSSEYHQAACRKAAVQGATYLLSQGSFSINKDEGSVTSKDNSWTISARNLFCPIKPDHQAKIQRYIYLIRGALFGESHMSSLFVIPPKSSCNIESQATINVLQLNSDTKCVSQGFCLLHVWSMGGLDDGDGGRFEEGGFGKILRDSGAEIKWKSDLLNFQVPYHALGASQASVPFQPIEPASFMCEKQFVNQLDKVKNQLV